MLEAAHDTHSEDSAGKRRGLDPERRARAPAVTCRLGLRRLSTSAPLPTHPSFSAVGTHPGLRLSGTNNNSLERKLVRVTRGDTWRLSGDSVCTGERSSASPVPPSQPSHLSRASQVRGARSARGSEASRRQRGRRNARGCGRQSLPGCDAERASLELRNMSANGSAATEPRLCHVRKTPDFDGYGFNLHAEKGKPGQYIGKVDDGSPAEAAGLKRGDRILEVNGHSIAGESHKQVVARIKERPDDAELLVTAPAPGEPVPDLDAPAPELADAPDAPEARAPSPAEPPRLNLRMTAAEMRAHLAAKKKIDPKKVPMDLKSKFDIVKKL